MRKKKKKEKKYAKWSQITPVIACLESLASHLQVILEDTDGGCSVVDEEGGMFVHEVYTREEKIGGGGRREGRREEEEGGRGREEGRERGNRRRKKGVEGRGDERKRWRSGVVE